MVMQVLAFNVLLFLAFIAIFSLAFSVLVAGKAWNTIFRNKKAQVLP
jgi:hypothetical protein